MEILPLWQAGFSMSAPVPALAPIEFTTRLQSTAMTARDVRTLGHDLEFHTIRDRNFRLVFFKSFAFDECCVHISGKQLANIYQITIGQAKPLHSVARKRVKAGPARMDRPPIATENQEYERLQVILEAGTNRRCLRKGDVFDEVERRYGKL
jgi:hypothetical protein